MRKDAKQRPKHIGERAYHAREHGEVLAALGSNSGGLSSTDAAQRLQAHGRNELPSAAGRNPFVRFLGQFNNSLIYLLIAAALAAWILGHTVDAAVIVAVVMVNAIVGFIQEGKAEKALNAIRGMISPHANVLRDGRRSSVPASDLAPGDLVLLEAGDRVPADLRLLRARNLLIEEAVLTGESVAAEKHERPAPADAALGDRFSMAYSGTIVAAGQGTGIVVATGMETEIGRISAMLAEVPQLVTPLLRQINRFSQRFTWMAVAAAAALFAFAVLVRDFAWPEALIAVVALAVGVVPEGLLAVITITLAIGVQRMAARNAVIRRLPAVETLGATSVICSDKTGTLTLNEMTARHIAVAGHEIAVSGLGYAPDGELEFPGCSENARAMAAAQRIVRAGLLCNDAAIRSTSGGWIADGDPMEGALVALAMKAELDPDNTRAEWRRIDEIPFDSQHRLMATLNHDPCGGATIFVKGAPERLLELCGLQATDSGDTPIDAAYWQARIAAIASRGERVLGFAAKHSPRPARNLSFADIDGDLIFLGIIGFIDPPRAEAVAAIAECRSAGITVKMITGDHAATAGAIAQQLGLGEAPRVMTGRELDGISDEKLRDAVEGVSVFARTSPEHKLRIVRALQADGAVVAMTGDGVNDAPSLKQADVGIAMGHKGTEAAKQSAEMVLLDDNFASIVAAVHEGRTVYDNVRKVVAWTLPTNGGETLTVIAAILLNFTMPMTPTHILWINLILTVTLGLVLAFEPPEPNVMRRPPRSAREGLLSPFMVWRVFFVSMIFVGGALTVFFYALSRGLDVDTARTMVVNVIVVLEIFYLFNVRYLHMTSFTWRGALGTPAVLLAVGVVVVAQFAFTYLPAMQQIFATKPVRLTDGLLIVAVGIVAMVILELEKKIMRRLGVLRM